MPRSLLQSGVPLQQPKKSADHASAVRDNRRGQTHRPPTDLFVVSRNTTARATVNRDDRIFIGHRLIVIRFTAAPKAPAEAALPCPSADCDDAAAGWATARLTSTPPRSRTVLRHRDAAIMRAEQSWPAAAYQN